MIYDDDLIRTTLRDFRIANGRDPSHIFMPKSFWNGHCNWMMNYNMTNWIGVGTIYGVKIVIWAKEELMCQPYIKPEVEWVS
jgi:hypothetical protein